MSSLKHATFSFLAATLMAVSGCAYFTAERVATTAGKEVGKRIVKKVIQDREEKKRARDQQYDETRTEEVAHRDYEE